MFLIGGARRAGEIFFGLQGVVEIFVDAGELGFPGGEGVRLVVIEHIAHGEGERIQIILHAEELQRGFAIAFDEIILQGAEAGDLVSDVGGVGDDGRERDEQPEDQTHRR